MQPKVCKCGNIKNLDSWVRDLIGSNPKWTSEVLRSILSRHTPEKCTPWGTPEEEVRRQNGN